jgi:predicted FMN-binding regulatory protein PaiB
MYVPSHFKEENILVLHETIQGQCPKLKAAR